MEQATRSRLEGDGQTGHSQLRPAHSGGGWPGRIVGGLAAVLLAAATVVVSTPLPAAAAVPGLVYVTAATNSDSAVYKSVRVFCPAGRQVIGGSYDLRGGEGAVVLDDFIPSATELLVGAGEIVGPGESSDGTTANWQIVATAVCASPLSNYSITTRTSSFTHINAQVVDAPYPPAGRSSAVAPHCPTASAKSA